MKLSILMPAYNEAATLATAVKRVLEVSYPCDVERSIVDDGSHSAYSFWYVLGNKAVTMWANLLFNTWISDLETCFKLLPLPLYRSLKVRSAGFGMEAEITGKLLSRGIRPFEVPITYIARTREQGKKLTWRDGVEAVWILLRVRLGSPVRRAVAPLARP